MYWHCRHPPWARHKTAHISAHTCLISMICSALKSLCYLIFIYVWFVAFCNLYAKFCAAQFMTICIPPLPSRCQAAWGCLDALFRFHMLPAVHGAPLLLALLSSCLVVPFGLRLCFLWRLFAGDAAHFGFWQCCHPPWARNKTAHISAHTCWISMTHSALES